MHKDILGKLDVDKLMMKFILKMDSRCLIRGKNVVTVHSIDRVGVGLQLFNGYCRLLLFFDFLL